MTDKPDVLPERGIRETTRKPGDTQGNTNTDLLSFMQAFQAFSNQQNQQTGGHLLGFQGYPHIFQGLQGHPVHMPLSTPIQVPHAPAAPAHAPHAPHAPAHLPPNYAAVCGEENTPSITEWLSYCDTIPTRKERSGIIFSDFSDKFDSLGFDRMEQLDSEVSIQNLTDWLKIKPGIATDILRHARADLAAIKAGRLIFPLTKKNL
jgi:hypothetical protein